MGLLWHRVGSRQCGKAVLGRDAGRPARPLGSKTGNAPLSRRSSRQEELSASRVRSWLSAWWSEKERVEQVSEEGVLWETTTCTSSTATDGDQRRTWAQRQHLLRAAHLVGGHAHHAAVGPHRLRVGQARAGLGGLKQIQLALLGLGL